MRSHPSLSWRLLLTAALLAPNAPAEAVCERGAAGSERESAKARYQAGLRAYDAKRYSEAIDHLTCANQLLPSPAFAYNIAVTYEAMGDVPTALRWYREHRRQAAEEADTSTLNPKIAELEAQLQARGVQQVSVLSEPPGAMLSIDDRPLGLTPLTLELNPGQHRYRLVLEGHETKGGSFDLRVDRSLDVAAALEPERARPAVTTAEHAGAAHEPRAHDRSAPSDSGARIGTWTWLTLGAGAALLGGALGFELRRAQLDAELGRASQLDYQDRHDAMTASQTTARVLAGLGAGALVAGGVLLTLELSRDAGAAADVAVGCCGDADLCLAARGAF